MTDGQHGDAVRQRPLDDDEMTAWRAYTETVVDLNAALEAGARPATA